MNQQRPITDDGAEAALILAILNDHRVLRAIGQLDVGDFGNDALAAMFADIREQQQRGSPVNVVSMRSSLDGIRTTDGETVRRYLDSVSVGGISPDPQALVRQIVETSGRRKLLKIARKMMATANDLSSDIKGEIAAAREMLGDVYAATASRSSRIWFEDHASELLRALSSGETLKVPSGIAEIDSARGGFAPGEYIIWGARPGMGKSALAMATALNYARQGRGVVIVSMEMPGDAVVARMVSETLAREEGRRIEYKRILDRAIDENEHEAVCRKLEQYRKLPVRIYDGGAKTVADIAAHVSEARREFEARGFPLQVVIVDHIGIAKRSNRYKGNLVNEIGEISASLADLAREQGVTVIALSQLSRKVEEREEKWPTMSDLRDSGNLEQDADVVMLLYRPAYYLAKDLEVARAEVRKSNPTFTEDVVDAQTATTCIIDALRQSENVLQINMEKDRNGVRQVLNCWIDVPVNWVR